MKLLKRLFNKYIQKQKAVYVESDSAYSVTMLQSLEPRKMFDAALGVEIANLFTQQAAVQGQEADFLAADTGDNTQANQAVDAFITDSTLDPNIITNLNDDAANLPIDSINLDNYYSFDKSLVKELVFVDSGIDNYAELLEGVDLDKLISGQMEVVVIDSKYSGIEQIGDYLNQYDHQLEAVHIVSHGDVAELKLGTDVLNNASLDNFNSSLASWGASFAVGADLLFYGCNVAEGVAGQKFVQDLHDIIETDIAASSDLTGHVDLGGDWELESHTGIIQASNVFNNNVLSFASVLATFTVTNINDSGAGSLRDAITQANSAGGADTIDFDLDLTDDTADGNVDGKYTITLLSALAIPSDITIDGTTANGYSSGSPTVVIQYSGSQLNINTASDTTIQGLEFKRTDTGLLFVYNQLTNFTFDHNVTNAAFSTSTTPSTVVISSNVNVTNNIFAGTTSNYFSSTAAIYTNRPVQDMNISDNDFQLSGTEIFINTSSSGSTGLIKDNNFASGGAIRIRATSPDASYIDVSQNNPDTLIIHESLAFQVNDAGDTDVGNNFRQNYPVINDVDQFGNNLVVSGILDTELSNDYRLEFFGINNSGPNTGKRIYLGNYTLTNVLSANQAFTAGFDISTAITNGLYTSDYGVYATATRITNLPVSPPGAIGATSGYSSTYNSVTVNPYDIGVTTLLDENDGDTTNLSTLISNPGGTGISLREAIIASNNQAGIQTIGFSVAGTINLDYDNNPANSIPDQLNITEGVIIDATTAPGYVSGTPVVTITSPNINFSNYGGFVFNNADGSEIRGLAFQVNITHGTSPNYTLNFSNTDNVIIEDNIFGNPAGNNTSQNYGVKFTGTYNNITIENNTFQNSFRSAIVIWNTFTDVTILNNTIKNIGANLHPISFNVTANNVSALVSGNTIFNNVGQPQPALGAIGVGVNGNTGIHIEATQNISYDITSSHSVTAIDYRTSTTGNPATTFTGPQANDTDDVGLATDNRLNYPVVTKVDNLGSGYYRILGYVDVASTAENRYRLEFFADDNTSKPQAQVYLGSLLLNNSNSRLVADNGSGSIQDREFAFITGDLSSAGLTLANIRFAVSNTDTTIGHTSELPGGTLAATTPTEITVTTLADENDGTTTSLGALMVNPGGTGISLREAIIAANNQAGTNTIKFNVAGDIDIFNSVSDPTGQIDVTDTVIIDGTTAPGYVTGSPVVTIMNSYVFNGTNNGGLVFLASGADNSIVRGLNFEIQSGATDAPGAVNVVSADNVLIEYNTFDGSAGPLRYGIELRNTNFDTTISNNIFHHLASGIQAYDNYFNLTISNNELYNMSPGAVPPIAFFNNGSVSANVTNNTIHDSPQGSVGLTTNNTGVSILVSENLFYNNTTSHIVDYRNNLASTTGSGPDTNDTDDVSYATNSRLNYPVIIKVDDLGSGYYRIHGYLDSATTTENRYKVELFAGDNTTNTQAEVFVGSVTLNNSNSSLVSDKGSGSTQDREFSFITGDLSSVGLTLSNIRFKATVTDLVDSHTSEAGNYNTIAPTTPTEIHVTTLADENDGTTTNLGSLIVNPGGTGISLREALAAAGNQVGSETIKFSITGTINLGSNLSIPSNVIIDGTTASGYVVGTPTAGINTGLFDILSSSTSNITIKGLNILGSDAYVANFGSISGLTITENVITGGGIAFDTAGANTNIDITNNIISGGYINVYFNRVSTDVTITGNTISNSVIPDKIGIQINSGAAGSAGIISNNTFTGGDRVHMRNVGSYVDITQNTFSGILAGQIPIDIAGDGPNTVNDPGDTDSGNNFLQNYPVLSSVTIAGNTMNVSGILDTELNQDYRLDFYANDNLANNDIDLYLGSITLTNIQNANQAFTDSINISGVDTSGLGYPFKVTATATRISGLPALTGVVGATSELSASITPDVQILVSTLVDELDIANGASATKSDMNNFGGTGLSLREAIYVANNTAGTDTIVFNIAGDFVFSLEAAANFKLPAITETLIIDGTTAPGYVAPATPVDANSPSNPTQAGASGLFGVNTTASANPVGPSQSLLGGVIGSTLDIYDGSNNYEADIKSALNTNGNIKVFFETTNQGGGTTAILKFESSAANSQIKGIGFLQNAAALSAIRSDVVGVDVLDSYFKGFTSTGASDGAVVDIDSVTNSVFDTSYTAINQGVLASHNTILNTSSVVALQNGDFNYNKVENTGGLIGSGIGAMQTLGGYTTQGNYFNNLNYAGRISNINFIENEVLNMAHATYAVWADNSVYTTMNKIHDNAGAGIYAEVSAVNGTNRIGAHLANSLYNNGGLGLDTVVTNGHANAPAGVNSNDFNDLDTYAQNTPYIGQVVQVSSTNGNNGDDGDIIIVGSLNSGNSALASHTEQFRVDFYANTGGLSGNINNSEAEYFLGYTIVDTSLTSIGYNGYFEFTYDYSNPQAGAVANVLLTSGSYIVATATGTVPSSATPSGSVFGTAYKTYETSEFHSGQTVSYTNAQELPTTFTPTIDYTGVITVGNNFTTDTTPILLGEFTQPYEANINISIVRIDDNSGGETVVHTANPANITKDLANGTWEYDLTSYFTAPVGAYRLDVTIDDGSNPAASIPGTTFSKVFVVAADSNSLGVVGETAYNNATSSYPMGGSVNNSSNPIFIEIDTGDGNGTQILQATANGATGWQLSSLPSYNITEGSVPYTLHVFNNSGAYDTATVTQGFVIDTTNPDADMDSITGLATAPELTGTFTDAHDVTAIIVSIAPTGSLDINNLVPSNTFVVGSDPHSVLNPSFQSVTGSINTASNTWTINSGQITGLSSGISYDVVVMGLDPAGNITSLSSGSILSGAITVTQNLDTVQDALLSSLNALLADNGVFSSGDSSLTGTASNDIIGNSTDDVVNAALRAASDSQNATTSSQQNVQTQAASSQQSQDSANAAQQVAQASQADASQAQSNQTQTAQSSGNSAAAQQAAASSEAAFSDVQSAEQSASGGAAEGGIAGALSGFAQAFSNVATGAAGSAGAVANIVFDISWNTMLNQPATSAAAAAAGFTLTLTVISGGQVVSVVITSGGFGSGAVAALQNATGSIFQNMGANMLRLGGAPTMTTANKAGADVGSHMADSTMQTQDFNQEQDVELSEDTDCILNRYINTLGRKVSNEARVISKE